MSLTRVPPHFNSTPNSDSNILLSVLFLKRPVKWAFQTADHAILLRLSNHYKDSVAQVRQVQVPQWEFPFPAILLVQSSMQLRGRLHKGPTFTAVLGSWISLQTPSAAVGQTDRSR